MVNAQTLESMFEDDAQEVDAITEMECVLLFRDHGEENDVDNFLYNTSTPTLAAALEWLGY